MPQGNNSGKRLQRASHRKNCSKETQFPQSGMDLRNGADIGLRINKQDGQCVSRSSRMQDGGPRCVQRP
jgi:hypothetical protein